jgi:hypothetical protein
MVIRLIGEPNQRLLYAGLFSAGIGLGRRFRREGVFVFLLAQRNGFTCDLPVHCIEDFLYAEKNRLNYALVEGSWAADTSAFFEAFVNDIVCGQDAADNVFLSPNFPPRDPGRKKRGNREHNAKNENNGIKVFYCDVEKTQTLHRQALACDAKSVNIAIRKSVERQCNSVIGGRLGYPKEKAFVV